MLRFSKEFYEDEYREGFFVDHTMKSAWAAQLEVLKRVEEICARYGLQCFAFYGTLLGAVRHGGFIPWDDDIDIVMKRKDYRKFLEVVGKELPAEYKCLTIYEEPEWCEVNARITNTSYIDLSEQHMREYHGCPFAIGIDIYPLDDMPEDEAVLELQKGVMSLIARLDSLVKQKVAAEQNGQDSSEYEATLREGLATLEKMYNMKFSQNMPLSNQLYRLYDCLSEIYATEQSQYLTFYPGYFKHKGRCVFAKEWFAESVVLPFENTQVTAPKGYRECLERCYGEDYMTPRQVQAAHGYPFYKMQKKILEERNLWEETDQLAKMITEQEGSLCKD